MAFAAFFRVLFSRSYAGQLKSLGPETALAPEPAPKLVSTAPPRSDSIPAPKILREADPDVACQVLAILQRQGRLIDFIQEDLSGADDAAIGAAARVVHAGCRKALEDAFEISPIREEDEDAQVQVEADFDRSKIQLSGQVAGDPPFSGTLRHKGWLVTTVRLPKMTEQHDVRVIAPAEIEL